ncbi:hypothetical protein P3T24_005527 [Paraburkholderia sp. GAS33]|jgi:hypothetical protein|uniref:Uncharacterized protein n=1 Tax=Paraburkholderia phenazinium TaxID=60549 RepID=A0A1N6HP83_9BURK|nr:hypothetical protein SAMN05444168_3483 [Paraburkholderia phenazinium]
MRNLKRLSKRVSLYVVVPGKGAFPAGVVMNSAC